MAIASAGKSRNGYLRTTGVLCAVLALSFLSGYHRAPADANLIWYFTPLGLLHPGANPYSGIPANSFFFGPPGFSLDYLVVFLKTCLLESPFYFWVFRRSRHLFLPGILTANFLTHPLVFFVIPTFFRTYLSGLLAAELFALTVESLYCARANPEHKAGSILAAAAANLFSWQVGF